MDWRLDGERGRIGAQSQSDPATLERPGSWHQDWRS